MQFIRYPEDAQVVTRLWGGGGGGQRISYAGTPVVSPSSDELCPDGLRSGCTKCGG